MNFGTSVELVTNPFTAEGKKSRFDYPCGLPANHQYHKQHPIS